MADSSDNKAVEAKCSCGSVHFTIDVPVSSLPLPSYLCHCSICRSVTGAPCIFHTSLPEGVKPKFISPSAESNMTPYFQEGGSGRSMFCSTCGCHVACVGLDNGEWIVATSIFVDQDNFKLSQHVFSKSAKDGGISTILTHMGSRKLGSWNPPDDNISSQPVESKPEVGEDGQDRLRAQCHCGGVSFTIKRPNQEVLDDKFMAQYVSPLDKNKWMALLDVCNDCRLINGTHIVGWAFLPLSLCEPAIKSDLQIGTSKSYSSSPGVTRTFCGTCGATVFYANEARRPDEQRQIVDLATGILRAPEGPMADNWLTWRSRVAWLHCGIQYDQEFSEAVDEGMKKRAIEKYGQELDVEIA